MTCYMSAQGRRYVLQQAEKIKDSIFFFTYFVFREPVFREHFYKADTGSETDQTPILSKHFKVLLYRGFL